MKDIENKLNKYTQNIWNEGLPAYPKLRTYITLKSKYKLEPYIEWKLWKRERSNFAKFRCGTLPNRIGTGRFRNERVCDRLCLFCSEQCIEDEKHFLLYCTLYIYLRQKYFYMVNFEEFDNSQYLFVSLINNYPLQTARFINSAYQLRTNNIQK